MFEFLPAQVQRRPEVVTGYTMHDWEMLIRQGRASSLLSRLHALIERAGLLGQVPQAPLLHLESARRVAEKQARAVQWEARQISGALQNETDRIVMLKGAAYALGGHDAALGRVFTDIDILVRKEDIGNVEAGLMLAGWNSGHHDEYDQRYYRRWMHEIPPMQHIRRMTVIDVHHAILPLTSRIKTDARLLWQDLAPVNGFPNLYTLAPADMILHSATHLFTGEFEHGMRDLSDIDLLLRQHGRDDFWNQLPDRARELGLGRPLYYALTWCERLFDTPVPASITRHLDRPARAVGLMNALIGRGLMPNHETTRDSLSGLARFVLYVRAHWLRMPLHLLIPHLGHKAFVSPKEELA